MRIPLFKIEWKQEDIDAVAKVIKRGSYWTQGPEVEEFEDEIAFEVGADYAVACNSGTSALCLALLSAGIKKGDEVIVPSFTFISTVNSVRFTGATPIFADIEEKTYALDIKDVKKKITKKTKAILLVHYGGCPAYYTKDLKKLADEYNIKLIEDSAAALGAYTNRKYVGTFGDLGIYSFCQNKPITTGGEGGMIVTDNEKYYNKLKLLISHGQQGSDYVDWGYNFRMPSINAALGLSQFNRLNEIVSKRIFIASLYNKIKNVKKLKTKFLDFKCVYWIFPIRVKKEDKQPLMDYLAKNKIATKAYYTPVHKTTFYSETKVKLPVTEKVYDSLLCLPIYPTLTSKEVYYVVSKVERYYEEK